MVSHPILPIDFDQLFKYLCSGSSRPSKASSLQYYSITLVKAEHLSKSYHHVEPYNSTYDGKPRPVPPSWISLSGYDGQEFLSVSPPFLLRALVLSAVIGTDIDRFHQFRNTAREHGLCSAQSHLT